MATKNSQTGPSQASTNRPRDPANRPPSDLTIVGIGASAGGLAPLRTFLAALPAQTGMSFVIVFKVLDKRHRLYRRQKCGRRMGD